MRRTVRHAFCGVVGNWPDTLDRLERLYRPAEVDPELAAALRDLRADLARHADALAGLAGASGAQGLLKLETGGRRR